ncbi:MAG: ATP-grasp domain-containing protein [Acidimicrobiales bacterium]
MPVMQLAEAAAGHCDLLWMIDGSLPEMAQMEDLLRRFGGVVDIAGLGTEALVESVLPFRPDGLTTYLDADMVRYAHLAERLGLPFHSVDTALTLTDKARQREVLADHGLAVPTCRHLPGDVDPADPALAGHDAVWPAVLKPRSAQGSRFTFLVHDQAELTHLLQALGPRRPEMVLEDYLADDPARDGGPYAGYVSVESVVAAGRISHLALTGRFPLAENFRETGFFIPAALAPAEEEAALRLATEAIEALGVWTGCLHTEVKFTPPGARIIEVNGRVGGGVPEMLGRAADVPLLALTLRIALGGEFHVAGPVEADRIGYRFFLQPPAVSATVATIDGVDRLHDHPGVESISVHQGPGADLDWKDGTRNHIMAVVGTARDYDDLQAVDQLLHHEVTVTYADVSH